jgi:TetR/AcrR family transcriptional regulator
MQNEPLPRREREKIRHRHEILDVALNLFSEKGYHNVSMHEIGERAEFAIGTLYKFFDNKEDLYKALVLEQAGKFHAATVQALSEPGDEIEKLRKYVRVRGEVFGSNISFIRLFLAESSGASFNIKAGLDEEVRKGYNETLELLALIFESGIKSGRFKEIAPPHSLAVALDSVINAFLLLSIEAPEARSYPENPDMVLDIFFRGLLDA